MNRQLPVNTRARAVISAALLAAASLLLIALMGAGDAGAASSGGVSTFQPSAPAGSGDREIGKYTRLWEQVSYRDRRWAKQTAECESGGDPDAIGSGGRYRGAFQFMRSTWRTAPRSPGGDPIAYSYRTQAVVAIALKHRDGAGHWPVCG